MGELSCHNVVSWWGQTCSVGVPAPQVAVLSLVAMPAARVIVPATCVAVVAPGRVRQRHR